MEQHFVPRQQLVPTGRSKAVEFQSWSWLYQLLPFVEEQQLHYNQDDQQLAETSVDIYLCPSRGVSVIVPSATNDACGTLPWELNRGRNDYAANAGVPTEVRDQCLGRCNEPGCSCGDGAAATNGIVRQATVIGDPQYSGKPVSARNVTDGVSHTIAAGEKRLSGSVGECEHDDNEGWIAGWDWDTIRWGHYLPGPDRLESTQGGTGAFGSPHPSVFQVAYCDGSVHSIRYEIDGRTLGYLSMRDDGQVITFE